MAEATRVDAFTDDALGGHDATAVASLVDNATISATEAVEAAIERAERVEPRIAAIQYADFERARARARTSPTHGPFTGVPTFIKDNIDLAGIPTDQGSQAVRALPAATDAKFASQFLDQGVLPLGKSRMPEFGFNATTEFEDLAPARNPWHTDYSTGASSGGSAALVAAGVVPMAHGNDGGGSIRIPAACCGLVGLKPSRGRLLDQPTNAMLPVKIICEGVLTRTVRDTARFLAAAERYYRNSRLAPVGNVEGPGRTKLRIGLVLDSITSNPTDAETRAAITATANTLSGLGHTVEEVPMPVAPRFIDDFTLYWGFLSYVITRFGGRSMSPRFDASQVDRLSKGLAAMYRRNLASTPGMVYRLRRTAREYARAFASYDLVLSPVLAHTTPPLGYLSPAQDFDQLMQRLIEYVSFTPLNNASGGPAVSLPTGTSSLGLPLGAHLSANHGDERTLLEVAFELEQAAPWPRIDMITRSP